MMHFSRPTWIESGCPPVSEEHRAAAAARQNELTKPMGSLGRLETIAIDLAGIQRTDRPRAERAAIIVFAGDHGIAAQGVSAYPQDVTVAMLRNFANGGAAISVLARALGCPLHVVDAGTLSETGISGVITDKPCRGTRDFCAGPALTDADLAHALACGRRAVERLADPAPEIVILGEMGIGNTTSAAAIAAALLAVDADAMTGSGTGLGAEARRRKARLVDEALKRHGIAGGTASAEDVLCAVGGLEIAALVGAIVTTAQAGTAVLIDGFIVSVAALAAARLNPSCRPYLVFSHRSSEQGHRRVLDALDARPLLDLDLRLGEASGAALALPLLRLACALHAGMATFTEAAVPDRAP